MDPLDNVDHRPWRLAPGPWIMAQRWHELLFAHWPVSRAALGTLVPRPLTIDTFDGAAWLGIIPFRMSGVRVRYTPAVRRFSAFPELNVRTYVLFGDKPGVYFFSLDAASRLAVWGARRFFRLPYYAAEMSSASRGGRIEYESRRLDSPRPADLVARYRAQGDAGEPRPGTLEHWLTERYCLYTVDGSGRAWRAEIHHAPWRLQRGEADLRENTMTRPLGLELPATEPLLHYADEQDVRIWPIRRARERDDRRR